MNNFWIYLLKTGFALWLFYGVYWFFLRKETFFSLNRMILLGSVVLSFLLPFLRLENLFTLPGKAILPSFWMGFDEEVTIAPASSTGNLNFTELLSGMLLAIYLSGVVILGSRLIYQVIRLYTLSKKNPVINKDGMLLIYVDEKIAPCSFLKSIFLHSSMQMDDKLERIILHESAHIKNMHFIDLVLFGMAGIVQWFNPVMWFFERSIREIHEYEADREVLRQEPDRGSYQALLVNQVTGIEIFKLANSFTKSITKKRMLMMSKMKSGNLSRMKGLLIVPVILCLIFAFSKPQVMGDSSHGLQPKQVTGKVTDAKSNEALAGAAIIIEGTTEGTISGDDGKFKINITGDDKFLVFSYVGYETIRIKADKPEMNVKMQKKVYDLPADEDLKPGIDVNQDKSKDKEEDTFTVIEQMPGFQGKGGEGFREYLAQNIVYPPDAMKDGITGKVFVQFTVNKIGEVVDVKVVRGVSPSLDKEAVRVVESSPLWEPGMQKGKPVDVQFTFPIDFKLK
jgi:TonB family protein